MLNFFAKKMMESQLKNLPKDQQEKIMTAFQKDPEFFKNLADEIKKEVKSGKSQQVASMNVMMKHKDKLRDLMS
jgi:hypothetical protein